jgi:hypothetical protein
MTHLTSFTDIYQTLGIIVFINEDPSSVNEAYPWETTQRRHCRGKMSPVGKCLTYLFV